MAFRLDKVMRPYGIYILFIFAILGAFLLANVLTVSDESGSISHVATVNKGSQDNSPSISAEKPVKTKASGSSPSSSSAEDSSNPSILSDKTRTSNLTALGVVGICPVISSPGSYVQGGNFSGAPNSVPGFGKACVVISSSNVAFDCNGYNITNNASGGYTNGILVNDSLINVTVKNCPGVSGYSFGIYAYQSTDSIFTNNTAYNNSQDGFDIYSGYNNTLANNTAYNNSWSGFSISSYNIVTKNTAYSNGDGFSTDSYNNINQNIAYNNTNGFAINSFNNLTDNIAYNNSLGFGIYSNNNTLANNIAYNSYNGFYQQSSSNNNYINNNAYGNEGSGFHISAISMESSSSNFINNTACNNQEGFILELEDNNLLLNNTACNNTGSGFFINSSYSNNLTNNKAYNNSLVGTYIENSTDTRLSKEHYYSNGVDFVINSTDAEINVNLSNVIFGSPAGNYQNFTNLSLMDSMIEENEAYSINWTSIPQELPSHHSSFANKFVSISATYGAPMIDYAEWSWSEDELNGYDESNFRLWKQNSSGWFLLNDTPDTELNTLSVSNLSSFSGFGILEEAPSSGICPDGMSGSGTPADPCQIRNWTNLQAMNKNLTLSYELMNDIGPGTDGYDLYQTGSGFTPIGTCSYDGWECRWGNLFSGTFEGNHHSITGLYINLIGNDYVGMFGHASGSTISNVALIGMNVSGWHDSGGLVGLLYDSNVSNCSAAGTMHNDDSTAGSTNQAGGLIGYAWMSNIRNCSSESNVISNRAEIGGLIGSVQDSDISGCHSNSNVSGSGVIGGLIGSIGGSSVSDSYSLGNVNSSGNAGGLIGHASEVNVTRSHSIANVTGGNGVGGLIGSEANGVSPNIVTDSYSSGNVNGRQSVGGLIGSGSVAISNSYSTGNVACSGSDPYYTGGLVGYAYYFSIINCSSIGSVSGGNYVGGLIGSAFTGNVSNSYSTGNVTGTSYYPVGGLIGSAQNLKVINASATGIVTSTSNGAAGGLIGGISYSTVSNSYAKGNVISSYFIAAGLIGAASSSNISDSYALGNASGNYGTAGLIGQAYGISLKRSYATGNVKCINSGNTYFGGLIGNLGGLSVIDSSYATGNVAGCRYTGGLIGYVFSSSSSINSTVNNSYATGNVSGSFGVGGLIGLEIDLDINNSYSTGSVNATEDTAGGLIGESLHGTITNSFATGRVSGGYPSGGLVGVGTAENEGPITVLNSYWDLCGTNQRRCVGNQCDTPGCYPENYRDNPDSVYFYNYSNGPMKSWGYPAWNNTCNGIGYPTLDFQNASSGDCRANEESACALDPWGSISITYLGTDREVSQGQSFNIDTRIGCTGGDCGNISAVLDPINPGFASGIISSSFDGAIYDYYDGFSSWDLVDQERSYSGKWLAMETGSLAGNCYQIYSGYDGGCYDDCYPGYIYLYDDVVPGISAGDSFIIYDLQQECESSFGSRLINWVHTSPDAPGFNQDVTCIANITPISGGAILWANFTVTNPQGNAIINNVNGTQEGQIWSSSSFITDKGGMWICNVTAFEEGSDAPASGSKKFSTTNIPPSINTVDVSSTLVGLGQGISCIADVTDPDDPVYVNFTIKDSGNNAIINNIRGTQAGDIWSSQTFSAGIPGTWSCNVSAVDNDNIPVYSGMYFDVGAKGIVPMDSGTPFYTTNQNPTNSSYVDCLANMQNGSACNLNWNITASGDGFGWIFFANATEDDNWIMVWDGQTSQKQYCNAVESNRFNVTIIEGRERPPAPILMPSIGYINNILDCIESGVQSADFNWYLNGELVRTVAGQCGSGLCYSEMAPFGCGNYTCKAVVSDISSEMSNIATIFNSPVRIIDVAFNATTIKEGESVNMSINLADLECPGGNCQVTVSVQKPGQTVWDAISPVLWINEIGKWVATITTQIGQGWVGLVTIQVNATDECGFCNLYGYCGQCTCQDYGYGYACGDSKNYTITVEQACIDGDQDGYNASSISEGCGPADCNDSNKNVNPGATEVCNGIDDDCDGQIDEGYIQTPTACGLGICASQGNMICQDGQVIDTCVNGTAGTEICDQAQLDEDCDGTSNEDCECIIGDSRPCYEGPEGTENIGICHNGTQSCDNGRWGECANVVYPADGESCNGLDDNCNGQVDEGGVCRHEKNEPSIVPETLLPLDILIDSISCQSDGTGDVTIDARDYQNKPLPGVLISIDGRSRTTGRDGTVFFNGLEKGEYSISASKDGYENVTADFAVSCQKKESPKLPPAQPPAEEIKTLKIIVQETGYNNDGTANVRLIVEDFNNNSVSDAAVNVSGIDRLYFTGNDGTVTIRNVNAGAYNATASKKGYSEDQTDFVIKFEIKKEPTQQPTQPPVSGEEKLVYSVPYFPILIILLILAILYILWKRRKKKQQVDEAQVKNPNKK
ncbi:MAG: MopE-related protein [Candidatus Micrarchaeota archaeon]|nr:MopE-related protein [Candidatus Micrarchaeota archaeon]